MPAILMLTKEKWLLTEMALAQMALVDSKIYRLTMVRR